MVIYKLAAGAKFWLLVMVDLLKEVEAGREAGFNLLFLFFFKPDVTQRVKGLRLGFNENGKLLGLYGSTVPPFDKSWNCMKC